MIIDANMHWLPEDLFTNQALLEAFTNIVPREYGVHSKIITIPGTSIRQIILEKPKGVVNLNYAENQYSSEEQIRDMDKAGIDKAILRIPCWQEWLDLEMCKGVNDGLAKHARRHKGRFLPLAVVPPWGTKGCLDEVDRCINDLGFSGVQLAVHYGNLYLDEEEFKPYFKKLNQMKVPVVVHHTPLPVDYSSICNYTNLRRQYGRCVDQMTGVGREIFSGMFEEFPNLKFIHSMLGGGFFTYENMLVPASSGSKEELERFDKVGDKVRGYLKNNIYFDISGAMQWGKSQLECAVKVIGADHILYGSSYPVRKEWFASGVECVKNLDIDEKEKELILSGNAVRLFNIKK